MDDKTLNDIVTVACTVYGEARGEPFEGKVAVANVIMNRVKSPGWWGKDITSVCLAPWQFSCWNSNDPNRAIIETFRRSFMRKEMYGIKGAIRDSSFCECMSIAAAVIGGRLPDITEGSAHYYVKAIPAPPWAKGKKPTVEIGSHLFFANID